MLKIYGSDLSSPANKVRFTANALGLKYEYIRVNLRAGEQQKPEFLKLHPAGKVPVIEEDGFVLFESSAIMRYLCDKNNSPLYPRDLRQRALVDQWIDFGSMHAGAALMKVVYNRIFAPMRKIPVDEGSLKEGLNFLDRFLPVIDQQLGRNAYLAGPAMTIADMNLLALLDPAEAADVRLSAYPHLTKWRDALKQKDFYTQCHREYGEALQAAART